jgi:uncharacterized Zn finger protein
LISSIMLSAMLQHSSALRSEEIWQSLLISCMSVSALSSLKNFSMVELAALREIRAAMPLAMNLNTYRIHYSIMIADQIFCPSCGSDTGHALIKSGQENLVRCEECGTVHSVQAERERLVCLKVIVSSDRQSQPYFISIPARELLRVGEELLVDDPAKEVVMTQITSLETDRRVESAPAASVKTVWARATDQVPVKISVYRHGQTRPFKISVPGDELFSVGEARKVQGSRFEIVKIKLRAEGFADAAPAKDIQRIWGREI